MAVNFTISAVIKAVDKITAPVAAITAKVSALTAPLKRVGLGMKAFSDRTGITRLGGAFGRLGSEVARVGAGIAAMGAGLFALAGIGITGILASITKGFSDAGDEVAMTATKLGVTTQELQKMRFAADMLDVSNETLDGGLKKLSRSITMASRGAKDQVKALRLLGYTDKQIASGKISVMDATIRLSQRMEDEKKAKSSAIIANSLYGKSYLEMMPLLKEGSARIRELTEEAERLGIVMTEDAIRAAGEFDDANKRLTYSLKGLRDAIGSQLLPILNPMIDQLKEWIVSNRAVIATKVVEFVKEMSEALKGIDWKAVVAGLTAIGSAMVFVAEHIGSLTTLFVTFATLGILKALVALWPLITAFYALAAAFVATPFGLVIAGCVALAAVVALIVAKWEPIKQFFADIWDGIKAGVVAMGDAIMAVFDRVLGKIVSVVDAIKGAAADIKSFATDNALTRGFGRLFSGEAPTQNTNPGSAPLSGVRGRGASFVQPRDAKANVEVVFKNPPPGTRVNSDVKGQGMNLGVDVGMQTGGAF